MKTSAIGTIVFVSAVIPGMALAQTAKDLVGTWKAVKSVTIGADGKTTDNFGPNGTGMAIFSGDGRFVAVNIDPDTPKFAANARNKGTDQEVKAAFKGGIGLYGTYTVVNKVVMYKVEGSTYPNWTGTEQKREFAKYSPNEFTWKFVSTSGDSVENTWKRVK